MGCCFSISPKSFQKVSNRFIWEFERRRTRPTISIPSGAISTETSASICSKRITRAATNRDGCRTTRPLSGSRLLLAAGGLVLGLLGAYALGRAMQSTLYGTTALNLPVLLGVGLVLMGAALVACYLPARRASAL